MGEKRDTSIREMDAFMKLSFHFKGNYENAIGVIFVAGIMSKHLLIIQNNEKKCMGGCGRDEDVNHLFVRCDFSGRFGLCSLFG
jgi:hypothetical protein